MAMKRHNDGDHIYLVWDGTPDAYYIKGHVSHEAGIGTLIDAGAIDDEKEVGQANQMYGRWSMEGNDHDLGKCVLRTYKEPGRGRFKITEFGVGIFALKERK
jgi:hypothetical protein